MNLEKFYFPDDNTLNFLAVLMVVLGFTLIAMLCTIAIKDKKEFKEMIKEDSKPVQKKRKKKLKKGCKHINRTPHWSDVFGYYESCKDCKRDL